MSQATELVRQAMELEDQERLRAACSLYEQALSFTPKSASTWARYIGCLNKTGQSQKAFQAAETAIAKCNMRYKSLLSGLAGEARQGMDWDEEVDNLLEDLLAVKPQQWTQDYLFDVLYEADEDREAIKVLEEALRYYPNLKRVHCGLGAIYYKRRDYDLAESHLRSAARIDPRYARAFCLLGGVLYGRLLRKRVHRIGYYTEAKRMLLQSIKLNPNSVWPRMHLGNLLAHIGDVEHAEEQYQAMLDIWPDCSAGLWLYADLLSVTGKDDAKARRLLTKALKVDPEDATTYFYLGKHLVRLGRKSQAKQAFQKAVELGHERAQKLLDELETG